MSGPVKITGIRSIAPPARMSKVGVGEALRNRDGSFKTYADGSYKVKGYKKDGTARPASAWSQFLKGKMPALKQEYVAKHGAFKGPKPKSSNPKPKLAKGQTNSSYGAWLKANGKGGANRLQGTTNDQRKEMARREGVIFKS